MSSLSTAPTVEERVEALLAAWPAELAEPFAVLREARESGRVLDLGSAVVLTHYADVKAGLADQRRLSNRGPTQGSRWEAARARFDPEGRAAFDEVIAYFSGFMSRKDGDEHLRLRRAAHRLFTPRRVRHLAEQAERHTERILDETFSGDVVDAMEFAYRLPMSMITDIIGVPESDGPMIRAWSIAMTPSIGGAERDAYVEARDALREFSEYVSQQIDEGARGGSRTELVSALMDAEEDERMSKQEVISMCLQLLNAAHETTMALLSGALHQLLSHEGEWSALVAEPSGIPLAIEESVRVVAPAALLNRLAVADLEVGGETIPAGTTVILSIAGANRDPAVFEGPETFDPRRANAGEHVGFGFGPHFCIGNALARLEAKIALEAVARRCPQLTLVSERIEWEGGAMLRYIDSLEVAPGPRP